jgi:trigger factor
MSYNIEKTSPCRVSLTATMSPEEVTERREDIMQRWLRRARIPGFRPGKAPRSLVERRFANEIREDLKDELLRHAWEQVREEGKLRSAGPLEINEADWEDGGSFRLTGEFDVYPEIELPVLDGFVPPPFELEPSAEELEHAEAELLERQAAWEPIEGEAAGQGMLAEAEVWGEFPDGDGKPFHQERSLFQIGNGEVYPEIEAAVVDHLPGDEVTATREVTEEAAGEALGKKIAYRILLKSLRRKRVPAADDAFAESLGVSEGMEKLRAVMAERLRWEKRRQRRDAWRAALIQYLLGEKTLQLPERVVVEETQEEVIKFADMLGRRGVNPERAEVDWNKLQADLRVRVEERLRGELVLDAAAGELGIEVDDDEVEAEVSRQAERAGVPFAELRGNLAKSGGLEKVRAILRRERTVAKLLPPQEEQEEEETGSDADSHGG